jgi:hypothetical protein
VISNVFIQRKNWEQWSDHSVLEYLQLMQGLPKWEKVRKVRGGVRGGNFYRNCTEARVDAKRLLAVQCGSVCPLVRSGEAAIYHPEYFFKRKWGRTRNFLDGLSRPRNSVSPPEANFLDFFHFF